MCKIQTIANDFRIDVSAHTRRSHTLAYLVVVEVVELGGMVVVVRTELEQMGQRREHEQQDLEQYLLGGASTDQQRQQEQHLDLDQFDDQHQSHPAGHEFLFEQLLCGKHMIYTSVIIRRIPGCYY